jgi:hypothetical protein
VVWTGHGRGRRSTLTVGAAEPHRDRGQKHDGTDANASRHQRPHRAERDYQVFLQ